MRWLRGYEEQLGELKMSSREPATRPTLRLLDPETDASLRPLGSFYLPRHLDGSTGINRGASFCYIAARDDLAAVETYLARFDGQPHTFRAYRKELERFALWCAQVVRKPMSSLLVDDCEAYKRFLTNPSPDFRGAPAPRHSALWRPFSDKLMSAASQKYALTVIRAAFDYLVKVRYLAGSPWAAVKDPVVIKRLDDIQVGRALHLDLWGALIDTLTQRSQVRQNVQDRIALAAILLMGDSGLRREEAARATRGALYRAQYAPGLWMLKVVGKRSKERLVPVSPRAWEALRAHWEDHGRDIATSDEDRPLFAPVEVPGTQKALRRHVEGTGVRGYASNAVNNLVKAALTRARKDLTSIDAMYGAELTIDDIEQLRKTSPHAFRHTFGSLAVEKDMPLEVVREIMGHEDMATTSIYVKAREKRVAGAAAEFYATMQPLASEG